MIQWSNETDTAITINIDGMLAGYERAGEAKTGPHRSKR